MAINLDVAEAQTRENRLGSITGYCGSIKDVSKKLGCGNLCNGERCFNQGTLCNAGCAQGTVSGIIDAVQVNHAPIGCTAGAIGSNSVYKAMIREQGIDERNIVFVSTNMNEQDTIFGATQKLKDTVIKTYERYKPKAIFVSTSCVSGVIGEDITSTVDELMEELPIPVIPVFCEGFKTKIWASGFDAAFHAILTGIVKPPEKKTNVVNFINFFGSERKKITEIFAKFGVEPLFIPRGVTVERLSKISESIATVSICGTLGTYLGNGLEEQYGVPYVRTLHPHGIAGYEDWIRGLGKAIGKEQEVEEYIVKERLRIAPELEEVKRKLKGLKAVIGMGPGFTLNYIRVLDELGIKVLWASAWHLDPAYDHGKEAAEYQYLTENLSEDVPFSVSDQQNYEVMNILQTLKPDIYLSRHPGTTVWAMKQGTASIFVGDEYTAFGYDGLINFAYQILDTVTNRSLANSLRDHAKLPYTDWWLKQNHSIFLKTEEEKVNA